MSYYCKSCQVTYGSGINKPEKCQCGSELPENYSWEEDYDDFQEALYNVRIAALDKVIAIRMDLVIPVRR